MPAGRLTLHVFEPRYVQMIDDILGQSRMIGIIQPRTFVADPIPNNTALCDVGTAGRIVQFSDFGDGRYHISLEGLSRFRLKPIEAHSSGIEEQSGYQCADVNFTPYQSDMFPTQNTNGRGKALILALMQDYFLRNEIEADWNLVGEAPYEALVSSLAMSCPFQPMEKQALLECASHQERAAMLVSLFAMSTDSPQDDTTLKH
ncbi:MAG: LON peptidase substrate-binding domain-containing protein [Magnetovibrio sp.]|nr:LON peptidase substrate-binding domain-containing protein [Magnetovibrio sp.]